MEEDSRSKPTDKSDKLMVEQSSESFHCTRARDTSEVHLTMKAAYQRVIQGLESKLSYFIGSK